MMSGSPSRTRSCRLGTTASNERERKRNDGRVTYLHIQRTTGLAFACYGSHSSSAIYPRLDIPVSLFSSLCQNPPTKYRRARVSSVSVAASYLCTLLLMTTWLHVVLVYLRPSLVSELLAPISRCPQKGYQQ